MANLLLIVGGGLFGSQAAAYARQRGIEVRVFDPGLPGPASPCAAGLFKEAWAGAKNRHHFQAALPLLDQLFGVRHVELEHDNGQRESFLQVPPRAILDPNPIRQQVTRIGDGWLEANGERHEGWIYVAAGAWCGQFHEGLKLTGKAGASFLFAGERAGRIRNLARGRQAIAFTRDPGMTFFSDGTAESDYQPDHDRQTLEHAASLGLTDLPIKRYFGIRPYTPGGPTFLQIANRTWLATGGRKLGTIFGAAFAKRLIEVELKLI